MNIAQMKEIKEEHGYTNEMIAEKSGVPLSTVQKIFAGTTVHPRYETLMALEDALGGFGLPADEAVGKLVIRKGIETSPGVVTACEPAVAYGSAAAKPVKKQGEYTLEDYYALPDNIRAELIDGALFVMESPTTIHQLIGSEIRDILRTYIKKNKGNCLPFVAPVDVQLDCDDRTMVQPDVLVVCDRSKVIRRCVYGAPDFIAEILSPSTRKKDLTIKLSKYGWAGVKEYWIVDPVKKTVVTYYFTEDKVNGFNSEVAIYGFQDVVPVRIYDGECTVDFREIYEYIRFLYDE